MNNKSESDRIASLLSSCRNLMSKDKFSTVNEYMARGDNGYVVNIRKPVKSQKGINATPSTEKTSLRLTTNSSIFSQKPRPDCKCSKDEEFESFCSTFHRIIKRIDITLKKTSKPRILLINHNGKKLLTFEDRSHPLMNEIISPVSGTNFTKERPTTNRNESIRSIANSVTNLTEPDLNQERKCDFLSNKKFKLNAKEVNDTHITVVRNENPSTRTINEEIFQNLRMQTEQDEQNHSFQGKTIRSMNEIPQLTSKCKNTFSDQNFDSAKNSVRPLSNEETVMTQNENLDSIIKDTRRTFQNEAYFQNCVIQGFMKNILFQLSGDFPSIGYVQGMNYVVAGVILHCTNPKQAYKIVSFLFKNLDLRKVYCLNSFETYVSVLKNLLKVHLPEFYAYFENVAKTDFKILVIDWFFCLGLNKIPLEFSGVLLENILLHGWFFFFRLMINYFKLFYKTHQKRFAKSAHHSRNRLELELELKNFFKAKLDWEKLLKKSCSSSLQDKIIDNELCWAHSSKFARLDRT
jgi:hypothetical protein